MTGNMTKQSWMNRSLSPISLLKGVVSISVVLLLALGAKAGTEEPTGGGPAQMGPAPGHYKVLADDGKIRIPFELFRGDIRMEAEINGKKVRMLLDNGFLWDQLLFFGSPAVDALGLEYNGEIDVGGSGSGDPVKSHTASGITIRFSGVEFYEQDAVITPYSSGVSKMWWGAEGQISAAFFKHFVVDVDFDEMIITLIEPKKFERPKEGTEVPLKPVIHDAWGIPAALELANGRKVTLDLMMDLGDGGALQLSTKGPSQIDLPENALPASLGFGIQGEILGHFGRIAGVEIGGYESKNVLAAFVSSDDDADRFHEAIIGMALMSRFNLIFDYPSRRMFIRPNRTFPKPFEYDMSGMALQRSSSAGLEIVRIHPGSPAEEAGLKKGDKVLKINGRPAQDYDVWELHPIMRKEGDTVMLSVIKDGEETAVPIKLRRIL
ncbi:MAG: PDZ domain-containing protein [Planctomycetota bacterium]